MYAPGVKQQHSDMKVWFDITLTVWGVSGIRSRALKSRRKDLPGSLVVKTHYFYCRGHGFDPWSGNLKKKKARRKNMRILSISALWKVIYFLRIFFIKGGCSFYLRMFSFLLIAFWFQRFSENWKIFDTILHYRP